ncbi:hypothetical protein LEP1GSC008_4600 [Leptospira kirschneri serovar Bulgarica str. Nikolaevo]|uniref:Uncharacterized protein n=1 Tax=Leptospira kirschneri serovar Bulgarica str. Nikolaevo TaxID=1240687 RepID=M6FIV6_9LEPT|nr:hypothetical protein LEP1GSC008_4600 [Leptospira kirschneri serovar Bulgarica str. Nikolaevo]
MRLCNNGMDSYNYVYSPWLRVKNFFSTNDYRQQSKVIP